MNNSNALAEIQSKYPNCNLLLPAATSVQINPFYKCSVMEVVADTKPNSGDIFSVGKVTKIPGQCVSMLIDEEGRLKPNTPNLIGSYLYKTDEHNQPIVGNVNMS